MLPYDGSRVFPGGWWWEKNGIGWQFGFGNANGNANQSRQVCRVEHEKESKL